MMAEDEVDKAVRECKIPRDSDLIAKGIKSDVVCRTYLNFEQLKSILIREMIEEQNYRHATMQVYSDGYEIFKQRLIYEFRTLDQIFAEIFNQHPKSLYPRPKN